MQNWGKTNGKTLGLKGPTPLQSTEETPTAEFRLVICARCQTINIKRKLNAFNDKEIKLNIKTVLYPIVSTCAISITDRRGEAESKREGVQSGCPFLFVEVGKTLGDKNLN